MAKNKVHVNTHHIGLRFALGLPLSGQNLTNRGPLVRGNMVLDDRFRPRLNGWYEPSDVGHRAAYQLRRAIPQLAQETGHGFITGPAYRSYLETAVSRWVCVAGALGIPVEVALGALPAELLGGVGLTTVGAAVTGQVFKATEGPKRQFRQALVTQLSDALDGRQPRVRMDMTRVGSRQVDELRVAMPSGLVMTELRRKAIASAIRQVLPTHTELDWPDFVTDSTLVTTAPTEAPTLVTYRQVASAMKATADGTVVLGIDASHRVVTTSLDTDDPHVVVSMSSGRGKSVMLRNLIAQFLEQGCFINLADVKKISLHEFKDTPGIRIYREVDQIRDMISTFKTEMMERYETLVKVSVAEWPAILAGWRRKILMFEEMNAFAALSQIYWDSIREPGERAAIPWMLELGEILSMARQVKMHVVVVGQRIDSKTVGNGNNRENFGTKIFSNPTPQTWRMFADGKKPSNSKIKGRNVGIIAGEQTIYQGVFMTFEEAIEHSATPRGDWTDVLGQSDASFQVTDTVGHGTEAHGVTLREIAEKTGLNLEAVRRRATRAGWEPIGKRDGANVFPESVMANVNPYYDPTTLVEDVD